MKSQLDFREKYCADDKTKCFVDCEELQENTAKFNFEENTLKLDKTNLSREQLKRISNRLKKLCRNLWKLSKSYSKSGLFSLAKQ